jgi:FAD synthetase
MSEFHIPSVMICGTFDLLHPGHIFFIEEAARLGRVIVVVARDETVERIKGRKPVETLESRKRSIEQRFPEATVVEGSVSDFLEPVRKHHPDLLLLGYDQALPPRVMEADLACRVIRATAHHPEKFKSSLMKTEAQEGKRASGG